MKYSNSQLDESDEQNYIELPSIKNRHKASKRRSRPISVNLIDTQYQVVEQVCWDLNFNVVIDKEFKNWDVKWIDGPVSVDILNKLQSHQKINHFPGMNTLSRKNNLAKNMAKMQCMFPQYYNFSPKTFILPTEASQLRSYFNDYKRRGKTKTFIVKPEASCQGKGIFLSQSIPQIQGYGQCVVQTYIDNPLLYKGLKFDLRIYAMVAGCDPLRVYIYNEGLVRFATEKYHGVEEQDLDNLYMHLTNYAINKDSPKYVFNQSLENLSLGHKKSLAQFFQTLKGLGLPAHEYWSNIKETIVKTLISAQPHLQRQYRMAQQNNLANNMCFEVLGFDFMLDDKNKLYLLEVNYTPSFSAETPLDHLIKSNLIRDSLVLMNVTPEARDRAQKTAKQVLDRRVFTGKMMKLSPQERLRQVRELQKERDEYEKKCLGSFEKIYPSRNEQRQIKYQTFLSFATQEYKDSASPQKIGRPRRSSSKYRIKKMVSNSTINEQQILKDGQTGNKNKNITRQYLYNPEHQQKNNFAALKLKDKLTFISPSDLKKNVLNDPEFQSQVQIKPMTQDKPKRGIGSVGLQTQNGQSTMFSKNYNAQTAG